jgi:hypothetical protein
MSFSLWELEEENQLAKVTIDNESQIPAQF